MKQTLKTKEGFTLVEIMMVVAIIGLLVTMATPSFVRARDLSQTSICVNNLRQLDGAKTQHALEVNLKSGDIINPSDLDKYLKRGFSEVIDPAGGDYEINAVGTTPTCTTGGLHTLD